LKVKGMTVQEHLLQWFKTWNTTTVLAVWGAALSTATAVWSVRKDLHDKPKIKVKARLRCIGLREVDRAPYMASPALNIAGMDDRLYVVVSVTNVGRRRIRWQGWGGKYKEPVNGQRGFTVSARFLPRALEEQEHLDEWTDLDQQFVKGNVERLYIWDVARKEWDVPEKDMQELAADIKKYAEVPPDVDIARVVRSLPQR
jgi:hypothetical protein